MRPRFLQTGDLLTLFGRLAIAILLALTIWHVARMLRPSLSLPWFTSSDENVLVGEVIRFSGLDFRQGFFDMPGTPLMLLGAFEWRLYYSFAHLAHSAGAGLNVFTFQHLQRLFTMLRVDSLVFFILSALLLFRIVYKAANEYAGAAAALPSGEIYRWRVERLLSDVLHVELGPVAVGKTLALPASPDAGIVEAPKPRLTARTRP